MPVSSSAFPARAAAAVVAHLVEDVADQYAALRGVDPVEHALVPTALAGDAHDHDGNAANGSSRASAPVGSGSLPCLRQWRCGTGVRVILERIIRSRNARTLAVASGSSSGSAARSARWSLARLRLIEVWRSPASRQLVLALAGASSLAGDGAAGAGFCAAGWWPGVTIAGPAIRDRLPLLRRALVAVGRGDDAGGPLSHLSAAGNRYLAMTNEMAPTCTVVAPIRVITTFWSTILSAVVKARWTMFH